MVAALVTLLCTSLHLPAAPLARPPVLGRALAPRHSVATMVVPDSFANEFASLPADVFSNTDAAAGAPLAEIFVLCAVIGGAAAFFALRGEDTPEQASPADEKIKEKMKGLIDKDEDKARTEFGWLHADLRVPLPPIELLKTSCHLIGEHEGRQMYLCASEKPEGIKVVSCYRSSDFSKYYDQDVYLCTGPTIERSKGWGS